jgi:beta-lactam-binding protein with PASTA domain
MASEPDRPSVADDAPTLEGSERTAGDGNWPVSDLYYVDPDARSPDVSEPDEDTEATVVAPAAAPARRRFASTAPVSAALALLLLAGALLLGAVLLGAGDDDPAATGRTPTGPSTPPPPAETTPIPPPAPAKAEVADVEGMSLAKASTALERQGFEVRVTRSPSERPRGEVLNQEPPPGSKIPKGTVVALVASRGSGVSGSSQGPEKLTVPGVIGLSELEAVTVLRDAGLDTRVRAVASRERRGTVIDQVPTEGTEVARDSTVQIEVAKPPAAPTVQRVEVPDVVGAEASAARGELRTAGLRVTTVAVASQQPIGTVTSQSPRAGAEVRKGARVRLTVSSGPAEVAVPDVTGLDELSARQELERAGFQVQVTDESITEPMQDGVVLRQTPSGGSSAEDGAVVTIVVGRLG